LEKPALSAFSNSALIALALSHNGLSASGLFSACSNSSSANAHFEVKSESLLFLAFEI
jgi:hypothetical protein